MRRHIAALLVGVFMVPQLLSAQPIAPGTRVRVSHPGEGTRTGTVVSLTVDTLEVRLAGRSASAHLPLAEVTRLDVSVGRQRHVLRYGGMGFLVGAGVGGIAGALAGSSCGGEFLCPGPAGGAAIGGVFIGSFTGILGLVAGVIPTETWERVSLESRRISLVAPSGRHGRGVGLSVAF